ncbi:hypothetical protein A4G19_01670 [Pasteurellaceae bacterium Macca]|nr:hypothetical protein [Pasteurellaceae bacterium Macca]
MINLFLFIGILLGLGYAIYDQVLMPRLKGQTRLAVELQRQSGIDTWISVGLIVITIIQGIQTGISALTLFLLAFCIILAVYLSFFRSPRLLLKEKGLFFANFYFPYEKIQGVNLSADKILVIDLHKSKRLLVRIKHNEDIEKVVQFFGGYKA